MKTIIDSEGNELKGSRQDPKGLTSHDFAHSSPNENPAPNQSSANPLPLIQSEQIIQSGEKEKRGEEYPRSITSPSSWHTIDPSRVYQRHGKAIPRMRTISFGNFDKEEIETGKQRKKEREVKEFRRRKKKRGDIRPEDTGVNDNLTSISSEGNEDGMSDFSEDATDDERINFDHATSTDDTATADEFEEGDDASSMSSITSKKHYVPKFLPHRHRRREREREDYEKDINRNVELGVDGNEKEIARLYRRTPVFSGAIAPFSIMLEIPGFTSRWYIRKGGQVYRPNPPLLDVGLAISLACAVVANAAIVARFAERLSPRKATMTAVCGFVLHDIINIVALVAFGVIHAVDDGFTYSEAYWMTTASTGTSLLCTTTLILDYVNTTNFKNAGSGLTHKQSQLVMVIMAFLAYISFSALLYALIMDLQFLDAMYFMVESLATVGLGDVVPTKVAARVLLFFIAPGGIVLLAVVIAIARQTILEELENAYKKRRAEYKDRLARRSEEKRENKKIRRALQKSWSKGSSARFPMAEFGMGACNSVKRGMSTSTNGGRGGRGEHIEEKDGLGLETRHHDLPSPIGQAISEMELRRGTSEEAPRPQQEPRGIFGSPKEETKKLEEGEVGGSNSIDQGSFTRPKRSDTMSSTMTRSDAITAEMAEMENQLLNQRKEIDVRFDHFKRDLNRAERTEFWAKLGVSAFFFAGFWVVGAAVFSAIEGWTYFEGFYFSFIIFSSIGYGDLTPRTSSGRAFFVVWTLVGFGTLTVLLSIITDAWGNFFQKRKSKTARGRKWEALKRQLHIQTGRRRRAEREVREKREASEQTLDGKGSKEEVSGLANQVQGHGQWPIIRGGGILRHPAPSSSNGDEEGQKGRGEQLSQGEQSGLMSDLVSDLPVALTRNAMAFHQGALHFLHLNRHTLVDAFRHFPDIVELLPHMGASDTSVARSGEERQQGEGSPIKRKLTRQEREKVMTVVEESGDETLANVAKQFILMADLEESLHLMIRHSAIMSEEYERREIQLASLLDQVSSLQQALNPSMEDSRLE